jgi:hypothetical protein
MPALITSLDFVDVSLAFGGQPRFHPALFAFCVIPYVRISHGRQFTGGVF